jgi:dienelactone hydrolase
MTAPEADLTGWTASSFAAEGITHDVYRKGDGPGVVLIPEIPGLTPQVLALGNHLVDNGFSVASPSLFGQPGRPLSVGYVVPTIARACVAREFMALATNAERPVARYLRALARDLNERTPGKGVGVIGMCFTGGFALAAAVDDSVRAPVLGQPAVPLPITPARRRNPGVSEKEMERVVQRASDDGLCAIGLRFTEDPMVPGERFQTLRQRLGDAFEVIEIDSSAGNAHGFPRMAHSVLTDQVRETDGHPAYEARKRVVEFLNERLR